jgi:hypothetical protein
VGQSVLMSGTHLGPATKFSLSLIIFFRQLWVCWCGTPSLTRGRVCSFQLLLGLTSGVFLGSESHSTHDHNLLFQEWDASNLEGQVPVFICPRDRVAQLYSQALGLSVLFTYYFMVYLKFWMHIVCICVCVYIYIYIYIYIYKAFFSPGLIQQIIPCQN